MNENNYTTVETTSARNGYPEHLVNAVIGFKTFDEAKDYADVNKMELIWLDRKDGWNLWHRGNQAYFPLTINEETLNDCQHIIRDVSEVNIMMQEEVNLIFEDSEPEDARTTAEKLKAYASYFEELASVAEDLDDEIIILDSNGYMREDCKELPAWEVVQEHPIEWREDTQHTILAAIKL